MRTLILFAMGMLAVAVVLRFLRFTDESDPIFHLLTFYFLIFIVLTVSSEFSWERIVRFFSFLKSKIGLGFFLVFISLLLLDPDQLYEMFTGIVIFCVALAVIAYGCKVDAEEEAGDAKNEKEEKEKGDKVSQKEEQHVSGAADIKIVGSVDQKIGDPNFV